MELRAEVALRSVVEGLGVFVLLREVLTTAGLLHSVLNVQDYAKGTPLTQGLQFGCILDGGFTLTLQEFPASNCYNCTLRNLGEKKWHGPTAAGSFNLALKKTKSTRQVFAEAKAKVETAARKAADSSGKTSAVPPSYIIELLKQLRLMHPDGLATASEIRTLAAPSFSDGRAPNGFVRTLERMGWLVCVSGAVYGVVPPKTPSTTELLKKYKEAVGIKAALALHRKRTGTVLDFQNRLEAIEKRRAKAAEDLEQAKKGMMKGEEVRALEERLALLTKPEAATE
jgi:hypothetical protein